MKVDLRCVLPWAVNMTACNFKKLTKRVSKARNHFIKWFQVPLPTKALHDTMQALPLSLTSRLT